MEAICIANKHAEILFFSRFNPHLTKNVYDDFFSEITSSTFDPEPFMVKEDKEFTYIFRDDLYWVSCVRKGSFFSNCGPLLLVEVLEQFYKLCCAFIGVITQHSISSNIILLQEIIIETMPGGRMHDTTPEQLRPRILSQVNHPKETSVASISPGLFCLEKTASNTASQQSILIREDSKKEIFIDVVEKIWATVTKDGTLLRSEVYGSITTHSYIKSPPTMKLIFNSTFDTTPPEGFNPRIHFKEVNFGAGIDTSNLSTKREITVITKPGESQIITYSLPQSLPNILPFSLTGSVKQLTCSDAELHLKLTSTTGMGTVSPEVKVKVMAPSLTTTIMSRTNGPRQQTVSFSSQDKGICWTIKEFPGGSYAQTFIRLVDAGEEAKVETAELEFEISKWVCSGLAIENINLKPPLPNVKKWVRYLTTSDTVVYKIV